MKTKFLTLFIISLTIISTSCNNKSSQAANIDYKYLDKDQVINCEGLNNKLLNEALYSFEEDLLKRHQTNDLRRAYTLFFRDAMSPNPEIKRIISKHTKEVFEALKTQKELWSGKNLNYNSKTISCIGENITAQDLKTTLNALISTNSMSSKLFGEPLRGNVSQAISDKYLALYLALDFYYIKLYDVDFSKINFEKTQSKVDFNKLPNS